MLLVKSGFNNDPLADKTPKSYEELFPYEGNILLTNKLNGVLKNNTAPEIIRTERELSYSLKDEYKWSMTAYKELDSEMLEIMAASSVDRGNHDMTGPMHYYGSFTFGKDMVINVGKDSKVSFSQVEDDKVSANPKQEQSRSEEKTKIKTIEEKTLTVAGKWLKANDLNDDERPLGGNVFGAVGVYRLGDEATEIQPPVLKAHKVSKEFLHTFKAYLVKNGEVIPWKSEDESLTKAPVHFVTYQFGEHYIDNYVWKNGYFFVEKHDFPHYFTAVSEQSKVNITLGRNLTDRGIELTTFKVPFGYTLFIEPNAIHTDSLSKGLVGLTLDELAASDTVYFRNNANQKVRLVK
jgi:hypothetical protein